MANNGPSHPASGWPQILLVLILAAGAVWVQLPIESHRPPPAGQGVRTTGLQDIDARLWQDPFLAASAPRQAAMAAPAPTPPASADRQATSADAPSAQAAAPDDFARLAQAIRARSQPIQVVTVLVPGSPWVGADELRRRTRYAVLAGLSLSGYVPEDPEHIGNLEQTGLPGLTSIPFEWLAVTGSGERAATGKGTQARAQAARGDALLLWLNEEALGRDTRHLDTSLQAGPLQRLSSLMERLVATAELPPGAFRFTVLGPTSSTFLKQVVQEVDYDPPALRTLNALDVHWYSPSATLPDEQLTLGDGRALVEVLPQFHRTIASDDRLIEALSEELDRRRVCARGRTVALVGQWDTAYARALRTRLEARIANIDHCDQRRILGISYLRGIDGQLPDKARPSNNNKNDERDNVERPEGRAQIDYLRRTATVLADRHFEHPVGAVGVLGDDYHDKLLILEALRPIFPSAVFFTTDLEAAMLHPADNKVTRNLVVASAYGLRLVDGLQQDIPPFRSVYQTSYFHATLLAMQRPRNPTAGVSEEAAAKAKTPQLYEIGRTEAVALTPAPRDRTCPSAADCAYPHVGATAAPTVWSAMLIPLGVLGLWGIALTTGLTRRPHARYWIIGLVVGTVAAIGLVLLLHYRPADREPLNWFQGISIWPSELLRLLAFITAIALLLRGRAGLAERRAFIDRQVFKRAPDPGTSPDSGRWSVARYFTRTRQVVGQCCARKRSGASEEPHRLSASRLWDVYAHRVTDPDAPCYVQLPFGCVAAIFILAFFGLGWIMPLMGFTHPVTPHRGTIELVIDRAILFPAVIAFLFSLAFAMHESDRAVWLAEQLRKPTDWPPATVDELWPRELNTPVDHHVFDEWLDIRFIGAITEPVQRIIFYPFPVLALLIVARSSLFDRWNIPAALLVIFGLAIGLVVIAALRLRLAAEGVRRNSVDALRTKIMAARAQGQKPLAEQLQDMLRSVQETRTGAFAPFSHQPLVKAVLTVTGTVSGIALLEYASLASI